MRVLACLFAGLLFTSAVAGGGASGELKISDGWARETIASARVGGGYVQITNQGAEPDRLIAASTSVARKVELHSHIENDGVMRMREVEGGIEIPAGGMVHLKPGGLHLMLMGLTGPLVEGERFEVTLEFERAGAIVVPVVIKDVAYKGGGHAH